LSVLHGRLCARRFLATPLHEIIFRTLTAEASRRRRKIQSFFKIWVARPAGAIEENGFAMDARANIKNRLPNLFEAAGRYPDSRTADVDLEPVVSPATSACTAQFCTVPTASEAIDQTLSYPATTTLAVARKHDIKSDRCDAVEIFKKTPNIADLKPRGRDVAKDIFKVGDIPLLMKTLLDNGHLNGNCFTGRAIAENLKSASWNPRQHVERSADRPATAIRDAVGIKRNPAPEMAVVKVEGMSDLKFTGAARCFDREDAARGPFSGQAGAAVGTLNVKLINAEQAELKTKWRLRATNHTLDTLSKYVRQAGSAEGGLVTRPGGAYEKQCHVDI
jgi:hypothetical protein